MLCSKPIASYLRPCRAFRGQVTVRAAAPRTAVKSAKAPVSKKAAPAPSQELDEVKLPIFDLAIPAKAYSALEAVVLLAQLGLADAAYSGDWSRIGVISTEVELLLQKVVIFIVVAHALVGVACGVVANGKNRNVGVAAARGLLFGSMALYLEMQQEPVEA